jgi:hypothetical protein
MFSGLCSLDFPTLQALLILSIAFLGLCIAWGQWVTARSKLILDLYDNRRCRETSACGANWGAAR